jgi:hypothetical protein
MLDGARRCNPFCYTAESLAEQFHWRCCVTQQEGRALCMIAFTASLCHLRLGARGVGGRRL